MVDAPYCLVRRLWKRYGGDKLPFAGHVRPRPEADEEPPPRRGLHVSPAPWQPRSTPSSFAVNRHEPSPRRHVGADADLRLRRCD